MKFSHQGAFTLILLFFAAGMLAATEKNPPDVLDVKIGFEPPYVHPARFFFVALTVTAPRDDLQMRIPDPEPFFEGFELAGYYDRRHELPDGGFQVQRNLRLQPRPGAMRFRMAPMAIEWYDPTPESDHSFGYQLVPAVHFERVPIPDDQPSDIAGLRRAPFFVARRQWWMIAMVATLLIFLAAGMTWSLRGRRRPMSPDPRQQACAELDALAQRRLPQCDRSSDFYTELTQIVRRFIERTLEIPATGRTTAEFLVALHDDPRINPAWVTRVGDVFAFADKIKFSGRRAHHEAADQVLSQARELIETIDEGVKENVATR